MIDNVLQSDLNGESEYPEIRVTQTPKGKGVFAEQPFPKGSVIGEITGKKICNASYSSSYCFEIDEFWVLEPTAPFRFVNHSCQPNCEICWWDESENTELADDRRQNASSYQYEQKEGEEANFPRGSSEQPTPIDEDDLDFDNARLSEPVDPFIEEETEGAHNIEEDLARSRLNLDAVKLYLIATRNIEKDEELSIDYAWPAHSAIRCLCQSKNCRGWIVDKEEVDQVPPIEESL